MENNMKKIFLSVLIILGLAGCAVSSKYTAYTDRKFSPHLKHTMVNIYDASSKLPSTMSYYVIGKVDLSAYASSGATPADLRRKAQAIARKKGADAIINAASENMPYRDVYVGGGYYGRHYYHPRYYIPYGDTLLTFSGELIVFSNAVAQP